LYYDNRPSITYLDEFILIIISQSGLNYIKIKAEVNIFFNYLKAALAFSNYLKTISFLISFISDLVIFENCLIK